jgi:O-antigen ligase/polysaccharide polymerase Wzy-like membrane protein
MTGLAPPVLVALFGAWCGTFWGVSSPAGAVAAVSLLGFLFWIGTPWQDPLRLGAAGRLLPLALWIAVTASAGASPVSRAGWVAVILLPAFLGLPGWVERCWRWEGDRRRGLRALAAVVAGVSLWALLDWLILGTPRPAMPLGHHNLLAAWLVILLPLAVLPAREPGPWRLAGLAAGALAVLAVLASRSLTGFAALGLEALLAFGGRAGGGRRERWWAVVLALAFLVALVQLPRIGGIVAGEDPSARARAVYWNAGVEGFLARPMLGWGPGAAAWTAAAFLDPIPRVNPWGEAVGDLHSLPVQLGYELGLTGILLALGLAVLFFVRRMGEREEGRDPSLLAGGLLGLGGGAVASLGGAAIAITALPLAAAVAAGAALAGSGRGRGRGASRLPVRIYACLALVALLPLELARWHYDRAAVADAAARSRKAERELASAARLDPAFPLYPMRLALLRARSKARQSEAAELAVRAADRGRAIPALWLVAGVLGSSARRPWAGSALEEACALDPLNPFPPFYQARREPAGEDAAAYAAHALLAEPRLAAALFWERNPVLFQQALVLVRAWPEVDAGWKAALLARVPPHGGRRGATSWVELRIDMERGQTLSLPVFRRAPWPVRWGLVRIRQEVWNGLRLPPAAASGGTSPRFLHAAPCLRRSSRAHSLPIR